MVELLVAVMVLLQVADAALTVLVIRAGGRETNPCLVRLDGWLRERTPVRARWAWLVIAKGLTIAVIVGAWLAGLWDTLAGTIFLMALIALYVLVVYHNWAQHKKQ